MVGRGWTQPGGRPHAETEALAPGRRGGAPAPPPMSRSSPAAIWGKTPPCAEALIAAGIGRAVVADRGPRPARRRPGHRPAARAPGSTSTRALRRRGARAQCRLSCCALTQGRPLVTLKLAMTLDGRIATATRREPLDHRRGGAGARPSAARAPRRRDGRQRHRAGRRSRADLPPAGPRAPVARCASCVDGRMRLPLTAALVAGARATPTWLVIARGRRAERAPARLCRLRRRGHRGRRPARTATLDLRACARGAGRARPHAGPGRGRRPASPRRCLPADLVDRIAWFRAPADRRWRRPAGGRRFGLDASRGQPRASRGCRSSRSARMCWKPSTARGLGYAHHVHRHHHATSGRVRAVIARRRHRAFASRPRYDTADIALGASIACSGVCLTVVDKGPGWFAVEASAETLSRTTLGVWRVGTRGQSRARAASCGDELGGHIVTGHVDGVAEIVERRPEGDSPALRLRGAGELAALIAAKGSVAVDGVSLTVNEVEGATLRRQHHPAYRRRRPRSARLALGDRVNLEIDVLARYLARMERRIMADRADAGDDAFRGRRRRSRRSSRRRATGGCSSWSTTRIARTRATWSFRRRWRRPRRSTSWRKLWPRPDLPGADAASGSSSSACR